LGGGGKRHPSTPFDTTQELLLGMWESVLGIGHAESVANRPRRIVRALPNLSKLQEDIGAIRQEYLDIAQKRAWFKAGVRVQP
jgi:hypothetical protein